MYSNLFLTDKVHRLIMSALYDHINQKFQYQVGPEEEELAMNVMKHNFNKHPAKKGEHPKQYISKLMKMCMGNLVQYISADLMKKQNEYKNRIAASENLQGKNTLGSNGDVKNRMEAINRERNQHLEDEKAKRNAVPQFAIKTEQDNSKIALQMERLELARKQEQKKVESTLKKDMNQVPITAPSSINQPQPLDQLRNALAPAGGPLPVDNQTVDNINNIGNLNDAPKTTGQDIMIKKPEEFNRLVDNAYKYNNNFIKHWNLVVDSRDRNTDDYPNNYKYQIDFDRIYKDIVSVELVSANVPKTEYLINNANNMIYFTENGGSEIEATVAIGNYTPATLQAAIESALETAGTDTYTVTVDETLTNKYTITKDSGTLGLNFSGGSETYGMTTRTKYQDNSIGPIIGFNKSDLSGTDSYTGQNQYNLNGPSYILMHIHNLDNLHGVHNNAVTKSFCKITLDTEQSEYKFFKSRSDYIVKKEFSPPMAKLAQLNIEFKNYDGSFYDFGNLPHCLNFRITTLNQNQGYFF